MLKICLLQSVSGLGVVGQILLVKNGYAKNYLIPKNLAVIATSSILKNLQEKMNVLIEESSERVKFASQIRSYIDGISVNTILNATPSGRLYGNVSTKQISLLIINELSKLVHDKDFINKASSEYIIPRNIKISESIKNVGSYIFTILLYEDVSASISVEISGNV